MLEVATAVEHGTSPVTITEVPAGECFAFLLQRFDKHRTTVELFVRSFAVELCPDFKGAQWRYFETSTGTVYMVPSGYASLHVQIYGNGFDQHVSAEVAGLIVSIYVLNRLQMVTRRREHVRMLALLRNHVMTLPCAVTVFHAID